MEILQSHDAVALRLRSAAVLARGASVTAPYTASDLIRAAILIPRDDGASFPYLAVASDDKCLSVLEARPSAGRPAEVSLDLLSQTKTAKKPTTVAALRVCGEPVLVVGDKGGEAFAFPVPLVSSKQRWLLGQTATIITAMETCTLPAAAVVSGPGSASGGVSGDRPSEVQLLLTGDREESIRVSHFPGAAGIQALCKGHTRFVTALRVVPCGIVPGDAPGRSLVVVAAGDEPRKAESADPDSVASSSSSSSGGPVPCKRSYVPNELLVSGGGDGTLRLWHVPSGTLLHTAYLQHSSRTAPDGRGGAEDSSGRTDGQAGAGGAPASAAAPAPVNCGPVPDGSVSVVPGVYGTFCSPGPHCDPAMNFTTGSMGDTADEGGGGGEKGDPGQGGEEDEDGEGGGDVAEAAADQHQSSSSSSSRPLIIPRAFLDRAAHAAASVAVLNQSPPAYPVAITAAHPAVARGLVGTFLEGERALRLFRVCMDGCPTRLAPAVGQEGAVRRVSQDGCLPQARLVQLGAVSLPFLPLACAFLAPAAGAEGGAPPVLVVGGVTDGGDVGAGGQASGDGSVRRFTLRAYTLRLEPTGGPSAASAVDACVVADGPLDLSKVLSEASATNSSTTGSTLLAAAYGAALRSIASLDAALACGAAALPGASSPTTASADADAESANSRWESLAPPPGGAPLHSHFVSSRLSDYDVFVMQAEAAAHYARRKEAAEAKDSERQAAAAAMIVAGGNEGEEDGAPAGSAEKRTRLGE